MLPSLLTHHYGANSGHNSFAKLPIPEFLRRAFHRDQMELDSAVAQMYHTLTAPSQVFRLSRTRKMTKNHYYRDDPAFIVLQVLLIAIVTTVFGVCLSQRPLKILYTVIYECFVNYLALGALIATALWRYCNRFLMAGVMLHEVRREVEWPYSFDVHCNSFFPYFVLTSVVHLAALPLLSGEGFWSRLLANSIYAAGACAYCYVTFLGYLEMPMLQRQHLLLYPIAVIVVLAVLGTVVVPVNMSHVVVRFVWPLD